MRGEKKKLGQKCLIVNGSFLQSGKNSKEEKMINEKFISLDVFRLVCLLLILGE